MTELLDSNKDDFEAEECYYIGGTLIEAGSDTTRLTLNVALAAAILRPDWVERTRKQLDEVCGANAERLPNFSDMDQLPLIKGVAKESLRWKPVIAETGIPHALTKDDEFEGYKLPAGAIVTYNHWEISHLDYEDPELFYPERFLDENPNAPTKGHLGFGSGRRVCVGNTVAWNNFLISLSRMLYSFDFKGDPNAPIDTAVRIDSVFTKAPFSISIQPVRQPDRDRCSLLLKVTIFRYLG